LRNFEIGKFLQKQVLSENN